MVFLSLVNCSGSTSVQRSPVVTLNWPMLQIISLITQGTQVFSFAIALHHDNKDSLTMSSFLFCIEYWTDYHTVCNMRSDHLCLIVKWKQDMQTSRLPVQKSSGMLWCCLLNIGGKLEFLSVTDRAKRDKGENLFVFDDREPVKSTPWNVWVPSTFCMNLARWPSGTGLFTRHSTFSVVSLRCDTTVGRMISFHCIWRLR